MRMKQHDLRLCIITGIFPPDIGGPATYVSRLAASLLEQGHEVCVVTLGDDAQTWPFPVWRVSRKLPLLARLVWLFFALLRHGRNYHVWYINGLELPAILAGKLLRKRLVMKIVGDHAWERAMNQGLTADSIDVFQQARQQWKVEAHKWLRGWQARQADAVITPSRYLKTLAQGWGVPEQQIHVIYNAVESLPPNLPDRQATRQRFGISAEGSLIITVGRLVKWKGIAELIQAVASLDETVNLLILGDGPEKNTLTEFAEQLRVTHRVRFGGKTERESALAAMRAADLFVLNTRYEGFSHVLLEAMAVGAPVITTDVCGNPELVTHEQNGLLVAPGDLEALRAQIQRVLTQPAFRQSLIDAGRETIHNLTWERLLTQTQPILLK